VRVVGLGRCCERVVVLYQRLFVSEMCDLPKDGFGVRCFVCEYGTARTTTGFQDQILDACVV